MSTQFKVGDVVVLKSGGPKMTVEKSLGDGVEVGVVWFNNSGGILIGPHRERLSVSVLEAVVVK